MELRVAIGPECGLERREELAVGPAGDEDAVAKAESRFVGVVEAG